jgi:hypothetical protein
MKFSLAVKMAAHVEKEGVSVNSGKLSKANNYLLSLMGDASETPVQFGMEGAVFRHMAPCLVQVYQFR